MIVSVYLKNIRTHQESSYPVGHSVIRITGHNGAGKSTIGDALAFAFTGRDKNGTQAPVHLIREGEDKLEVRIETEKAAISRTLTRKKSSSLKMTPKVSGIPVAMNQTEFSEKCGCTPDTFLSAAFVGYFFTLDHEKRMEVLRSFVPPVDRREVLCALLSEACPALDPTPYGHLLGASKRSDIEAQKVAESRREVERQIDVLRGEFNQLHNICQERSQKPTVSEERFQAAQQRKSVWDQYEASLGACERAERAAAAAADNVKSWEDRLRSLEQQQAALPPDAPDNQEAVLGLGQKLADLQSQMQPLPQPPHGLALPDSDRCMTCGQVIGSKHRDKVAAERTKAEEEYKAACQVVEKANRALQAEMTGLAKEYEEAKSERARITASNRALAGNRRELQRLITIHLQVKPAEVQIPEKPEAPVGVERISAEEYGAELELYSKAKSDLGLWEAQECRVKKAGAASDEVARKITSLDDTHKVLTYIEAAYRHLDQKVFEISAHHYVLQEGYSIQTEGKSVTVIDQHGKPYEQMSTGEQIRTGTYLCEKIGMCLRPQVPFMFVDNADLVDVPTRVQTPQVFRVYVNIPDSGLVVCEDC